VIESVCVRVCLYMCVYKIRTQRRLVTHRLPVDKTLCVCVIVCVCACVFVYVRVYKIRAKRRFVAHGLSVNKILYRVCDRVCVYYVYKIIGLFCRISSVL